MEVINRLIEEYLARNSLDLIEFTTFRQAGAMVLRLFIDKPEGGITLGECASVNREIIDLLETNSILSENYTLEVSSPGIDRILKTEKDFMRSAGKEAVFYLSQLIEGKCQWQGVIKRLDDKHVFIEKTGQVIKLPLDKINKSKLVI